MLSHHTVAHTYCEYTELQAVTIFHISTTLSVAPHEKTLYLLHQPPVDTANLLSNDTDSKPKVKKKVYATLMYLKTVHFYLTGSTIVPSSCCNLHGTPAILTRIFKKKKGGGSFPTQAVPREGGKENGRAVHGLHGSPKPPRGLCLGAMRVERGTRSCQRKKGGSTIGVCWCTVDTVYWQTPTVINNT